VLVDAGGVVAIAVNTAVVPAVSTVAGATDCTPAVFAIAFSSADSRVSVAGSVWPAAGLAGVGSCTPIRSGPFEPAPNPWVMMS
jgi:hypothetical protein